MMVIGPLMIEHRLIERMVHIINKELEKAGGDGSLNPLYIDAFVEFMRVYADKCHHGKEEGILFTELAKKEVSREHKKIIVELVGEHIYGRSMVDKLTVLNGEYKTGAKEGLKAITEQFAKLAVFYTAHIQKEDKHFFIPVMKYFDQNEHEAILSACTAFDSTIDLAKYEKMVASMEKAVKSR